MASYVVMEPPGARAGEPSDRAVFIRDGFSLLAFLVPPLWLLWRGLWIEAALAFALAICLSLIGEAAGLGLIGSAFSLLVSVYVGLEGSALRIAALRRRGWTDRAALEAGSLDEAEIRYLASPPSDAQPDASRSVAMAGTRGRPTGPALGLFDYPGGA